MQEPVSPREARDQAADYIGLVASVSVKADNGEVFEIPNPWLLDDDQQQRFDQLQFDLECLDKAPDYQDEHGNVFPGRVLEPHRKNGILVEHYNVRLAKAIFGDDVYQRFKAAGGRANDVALVWRKMNALLAAHRAADSKSGPGDSQVAAVS